MKSVCPKWAKYFITCQSTGRLPIGTIGLGIRSEASRMRRPRPPQKRTTFIAYSS